MKLLYPTLLLCCLLATFKLSAQVQFSTEYGGSYDDDGRWMEQLPDSGFILTGGSNSYTSSMDFLLVRTDAGGNSLWSRTIGSSSYEFANMVKPATDGGFVVAGVTTQLGTDDGYIVKTDSAGNIQWSRITGGNGIQEIKAIITTNDGGYAACGFTYSATSRYYDMWLLKLNQNGQVSWQKNIGGNSYEIANALQQTPDGGFVVTGQTYSFGNRDGDFYLVKTDSVGSVEWQKAYLQNGLEEAHYVQLTTNGYILVGDADSLSTGYGEDDVWAIRTDLNGDTIWTKNYGGAKKDGGKTIENTADGGFIIAGITRSFTLLNPNYYLIKTDSAGTIEWSTYYYGSDYHDHAYRAIQTSDGGYAEFGYFKNAANYLNFSLIKLGSNGGITKDVAITKLVFPDTNICSSSSVRLQLLVKNFGTTNEQNVAISTTIISATDTTVLQDTIAAWLNPQNEITLFLNSYYDFTDTGMYSVSAAISHLTDDISFSNDTITANIHVLSPTLDPLSAPFVTCSTGNFELNASANASDDSLFWYSAGGELTGAGTTLTGIVDSTINYSVKAIKGIGNMVGALNNSIGTGSTSNNGVLKFDARRFFKLISVTVYAPSAGNRTIELRNNSGHVLQSKTVDLSPGEHRIYLDFDVPEGNDYQLGLSAMSEDLFRNSSGANFPYDISRTIEIYGTNSTLPGTWYYFYNWYIFVPFENCGSNLVSVPVILADTTSTALNQHSCGPSDFTFTVSPNQSSFWYDSSTGGNLLSPTDSFTTGLLTASSTYYLETGNCPSRIPVQAIIYPEPVLNLGSDTVILSSGQSIVLDAGPDFVSYVWNNFSTSQFLTVSAPGLYSVQAADSNGCFAEDSVLVLLSTGMSTISLNNIQIVPNPASAYFELLSPPLPKDSEMGLYNYAGECLLKSSLPKSSVVARKYDVSFLPSGVYLIRITNTEFSVVKKLIIQ